MIALAVSKKTKEKLVNISKFPSENPSPVLRVSKDKKIIYKNLATDNLLKKKKLLDKDTLKIFPSDLGSLINRALKEKETFAGLEFSVGNRYYSYSIHPIKENDYVNLYVIDITERKKNRV